MAVITGKVARITLSGDVISGAGEVGMEASITMTRERDKFLPVGTDIYEILTGMKSVTGTVKAAWITGGTMMKTLIDSDITFDMEIALTGAVVATASGCRMDNRTVRVAPGTDVMTEECSFTGTSWY